LFGAADSCVVKQLRQGSNGASRAQRSRDFSPRVAHARAKDWEIIADNLKKAGWNCGGELDVIPTMLGELKPLE